MWNTRATHRKRAERPNNPPTEEASRRLEHFNAAVGEHYAKRLQRELSRGDQPAESRTRGSPGPGARNRRPASAWWRWPHRRTQWQPKAAPISTELCPTERSLSRFDSLRDQPALPVKVVAGACSHSGSFLGRTAGSAGPAAAVKAAVCHRSILQQTPARLWRERILR